METGPTEIDRHSTPPRAVQNRAASRAELEEYASPAFIKRARDSYGSLFEGGYDIFEDDGGVQGKGRKRTRFNRPSGAWRVANASSPSPEPETPDLEETNGVLPGNAVVSSIPASPPQMLDEGVQTVEFDVGPHQASTALAVPSDQPLPPLPILSPPEEMHPLPAEIPTQTAPPTEGLTKSTTPFGSSLFGSYTPSADPFGAPLFPTAASATGFSASEIALEDQVRFGFTAPPVLPFVSQPPIAPPQSYPELQVEQPIPLSPARAADSALYPQELSMHVGNGLEEPLLEPPIEPRFQAHLPVWPISSEVLDAQGVEAHVPAEAALQSREGSPVMENGVPLGTALPSGIPREVDDYGYNDRRYQNEAEEAMVGMEERPSEEYVDEQSEDDDEDDIAENIEYDEDTNQAGDDYDMRNYTDVDDDEEGFEGYENQHAGAQVFDDGEGYDDNDDAEEVSDSDGYGESEAAAPSSRRVPNAPPVVIDLISDSEDEEPAAPPRPPFLSQASAQHPGVPAAIDVRPSQGSSTGKSLSSSPAHHASQPSRQTHSVREAEVVPSGAADGHPGSRTGDTDVRPERGSPSYDVGPAEEEESDISDFAADDAQSERSDDNAEGSNEDEPTASQRYSEEADSDDEMADSVPPSHPRVDNDTSGAYQRELPQDDSKTAAVLSRTASVAAATSHTSAEFRWQGETSHIQAASWAGNDQPSSPTQRNATGLEPAAGEESADLAEVGELVRVPTRDSNTLETSTLQGRKAAPSSPPLSQPLAPMESQHAAAHPSSPFASQVPTIPLQAQLLTPFATQPSDLSELAEAAMYGFEMAAETRDIETEPETHGGIDSGAETDEEEEQTADGGADKPPADIAEEVTGPTAGAPSQEPPVHSEPRLSDGESPVRTPPPQLRDEPVTVADVVHTVSSVDGASDHQTVIRLPPPPSEIKDIVIPERLPEVVEADGDEVTVVQLLPVAETGAEPVGSVNELRGVPAPESEDVLMHGSVRPELAEGDGQAPAQSAALQDNFQAPPASQPSESRSEMGDEAPAESLETRRATRSRPKKSTPTKAASKPQPHEKPVTDASIELARGARRGRRGQKQDGDEPLTITPTKKIRRSPTPEIPDTSLHLAKTSLSKASKAKPEVSALKSELGRRLRTELRGCLALEKLSHNIGKRGEFVAIATTDSTTPERTKTRQFAITFNITDAGTGPSTVFETQVYRAHKDSLPMVKAGDGVLLRNFEILALTNRGWGLRSHEASSYVVFNQDDGSESPQIKGPPVEDIDAETDYVARLKAWYALLDRGKLAAANNKVAAGGAGAKKK